MASCGTTYPRTISSCPRKGTSTSSRAPSSSTDHRQIDSRMALASPRLRPSSTLQKSPLIREDRKKGAPPHHLHLLLQKRPPHHPLHHSHSSRHNRPRCCLHRQLLLTVRMTNAGLRALAHLETCPLNRQEELLLHYQRQALQDL